MFRAMGSARPRTARAGLAAPAALVAVAVVLVVSAQAAQERTYVPDGSGHIRFKPRTFVGGSGVACGVFTANRLRWTRYGTRRARATGRVVVNTGDGGCAAGVTRTFHATLRLYRARRRCRNLRRGRLAADPAAYVHPRRCHYRRGGVAAGRRPKPVGDQDRGP
jgi:hypothetical protein